MMTSSGRCVLVAVREDEEEESLAEEVDKRHNWWLWQKKQRLLCFCHTVEEDAGDARGSRAVEDKWRSMIVRKGSNSGADG
ncbi:hypothetical protein BHE74_00055773 [Ensete ventricosum]|nr:hypothetical protein GW17_00020165 [Ensete ventricosum]RWW38940.1 hypothetical protein BHE74_00055773 [Ensete ventricosum]RZR82143.1 hypothetical protein BHM03_00008506 [Ensete ventricosum]